MQSPKDSGFTEHHYQSSDGLSLYYRSYGSGNDTVVCLPGLTRNSKDFHELATHLSSRYRILALDLRGRGQSAWDSHWLNYNPATYIDDTWTLLDELSISDCIMIGTSLGGLLAMIMAAQRPDRFKAIVLNDVGPEAHPDGYTRILASIGQQSEVNSWEEAAQQCAQTYNIALPDMPAEFWNNYVRKSYRESADGRPQHDSDPNIARAIIEGDLSRIAGIQVDPWIAFRAVTMPCLVLRGELSDILSEEIVSSMAAIKKDLQYACISGRGHAPLLNEPESLAAIETFLGKLPD